MLAENVALVIDIIKGEGTFGGQLEHREDDLNMLRMSI
jgi:hypothetical protein